MFTKVTDGVTFSMWTVQGLKKDLNTQSDFTCQATEKREMVKGQNHREVKELDLDIGSNKKLVWLVCCYSSMQQDKKAHH